MRIGIDLGGTNVRVASVKNGAIIKKVSEQCKAKESKDVVLQQTISMIHNVFTSEVKSIGIGVPSVVDTEKGIVYNVVNIPSWEEVHLKKILEEEFKVPVSVNNDCNCFALGEYHFGKGKEFRDVVCVALGTGVGAGIIINGELYNGSNTGAGEIGCLPYLGANYEFYCASTFFSEIHEITGKEAYESALSGDAEMKKLWELFGEHIGNLVKAILFTYDPQSIIFGGSLSNAFELFKDAMYDNMQDFPYVETLKRIKIAVSETEDVAILGASELK
jgi:glucokinase